MSQRNVGEQYDVFVAYAREDLVTVRPDVDWLRSRRLDVWFDARISAGTQWADELAEAIDGSRFVLFFASEASVRSPHCLNEIAYATDAGKVIVPVYLDQTEVAGGLKLSVSRAQAILRWQLSLDEYRHQLAYTCSVHRAAGESREPVSDRLTDAVWLVPAIRNRSFSGRKELIDQIAQSLRSEWPSIVALTGLAGVGKSQAALEYAYRHRREYELVAWIRGETIAVLEGDLVKLARELKLEQADDPTTAVVLNVLGRYLAGRAGFLLVFDDVSSSIDFSRYLPTNLDGHVMLTSRQRSWGRFARHVSVDAFSTNEALAFLGSRLPSADSAATHRLIETLGRLPLALEEAVAYIEATGRSPESYLTLFENHHRVLLDEIHHAADYPKSFRAALEITLEQLEAEDESASEALRLLAFVAPDDMMVTILLEGELQTGGDLPDEIVIDNCVSVLSKYSLISVVDGAASVHRLVQMVCRDRMPASDVRQYATRALNRIEKAFPKARSMGERADYCRRLLPHAMQVFNHFPDDDSQPEQLGILMARTGIFMSASSWSGEPMMLLDRAYRIFKDAGGNGADLAYACKLYGRACFKFGELEKASSLLNEVLEISERDPATKAKGTIQTCIDLAWIAWSQGDYARGEELARRTLDQMELAYGPRDPRRMGALSILARICLDSGSLDEAREMLDASIAAIESVRGYRTPLMCGPFMQISHVLLHLGKLQRAQSWASEAIELGRPTLSENHPLVSTSHGLLGQIRFFQGELDEARTELEMAIENTSERKRRLNQYEFVAACYLARTHIALGDLERAGEIAATYLDDVDHRVAGNAEFAEGLSLLIRGALAAQFGDQEVACKLGTAGDERIRAHFGDMHAYRLDALLILGDIYTDAGQALEARESYEAGIQIGEDLDLVAHPSFSSHLFGIAGLDESAGNAELAESTRRRAIQLLTTSLGPSSKHALLSGEGG